MTRVLPRFTLALYVFTVNSAMRTACRCRSPNPQSPIPNPNPVRIHDMNWMQVEEYLRRDDRAVLPLGSTEQHSHLRLTVDCILPERVAADAAEPLGVPVFPVVPYGVSPYF